MANENINFIDRYEAGKQLGQALLHLKKYPELLVLGLPRGGIPVAYEVAKLLHSPLDTLVVRKLGVPGHEELAMGAISSNKAIWLNDRLIHELHIPQVEIDKVIEQEKKELTRREIAYRDKRPFPSINNKTIILIDDGVATGATMFAAIQLLKMHSPKAIIVAVPVSPKDTANLIAKHVTEFVCLFEPENFYSVGEYYKAFSQTTDEEIRQILENTS